MLDLDLLRHRRGLLGAAPRLSRFVVGVNACAIAALCLALPATLLCLPAAATEPSLLAGYAFRSASDGRAHGASASVSVDVPISGSLALRPELLLLGFNGSDQAPASLGLFAAALSFAYRFDDTDARALVSVGPLAGLAADGDAVAIRAGALASLGLRFPVLHGIDVEARVALPAVLWGPGGVAMPGAATFADGTENELPLQSTFSLGVSVDAAALLAQP